MIKIDIKSSNKKDILNILKESVEVRESSLKIAIDQTREMISGFEKRYKMRPNIFYKKFQRGILGDKPDFIEWAGEIEILDRLKKKIGQIREISFAH